MPNDYCWSALRHNIKERVDAALLRAHVAPVGAANGEATLTSQPQPKMLAAPAAQESEGQIRSQPAPNRTLRGGSNSPSENELTIAAVIETYLKDVEPPQREPKTYEKYRSTLDRFRDTCKKVYVREIDRNDCLEFMRHLYSNGNEIHHR